MTSNATISKPTMRLFHTIAGNRNSSSSLVLARQRAECALVETLPHS